MALEKYHSKRTFGSTPEPSGVPHPATGPLRFVVQKHAATRLHYDFRLEMDGVLKSWAVPKGPSLNPADKHLAVQVEDHPYDYRTFEGTIPDGNYGAGSVMVWDEGTYDLVAGMDDHLTFILHGTKLNGEFALVKIAHADEENAWLLLKAHKDKFAGETDVTLQDRSVVTGRTLEEIAAHAPVQKLLVDLGGAPEATLPADPKPMLAELGEVVFDDPAWRYEIKWDGYRIMARVEQGERVTLLSRNGKDYTENFQSVATDLQHLHVPAVFDGEVVALDGDGRASFQLLQNFLRTGIGQLVYYAFDIIHLDGHDLTTLPLEHRAELLRRALPQESHLKVSEAVVGEGKAIFDQAVAHGLEGIIAKRSDSPYLSGRRTKDWIKLKVSHRQEAIIVGYTAPRSGRQHFGALVLGVYQDGQLIYAGHTGTGFDDATLADVYRRLQPLRRDSCPIDPTPKTNEPSIWVEPKLVAEISFTEWTNDGSMRHPVFLGLRDDKNPKDVVRETAAQEVASAPAGVGPDTGSTEETGGVRRPADATSAADATSSSATHHPIASTAPKPRKTDSKKSEEEQLHLSGHTVRFTHRSKVFWPDEGITKGNLLDHYLGIADTILPYLRDRPESLNRFPHGITGDSFYQKDMRGDAPDWADTVTIHSESGDDDVEYLVCQDEATLAYMINLGCIELNPWNSRTSGLDRPDWCVIDLDPEAIGFDAVIETARMVHTVLDQYQIPSYPKTSGATGIHIYIPLGAKYDYDQTKLFAQLIAGLVHARLPDITSVERLPKKRQGKVYLDFLQNRRGQTLAAPYSVRPQPGATVSTPLDWTEVTTDLTPAMFTIHNIQSRLKEVGDLWAPVLGKGIDLHKLLDTLGETSP